MNNIETNLLAAKIIGWSGAELEYSPPLDIFTNTSDRETVVIALGEKHGLVIMPDGKGEWYLIDIYQNPIEATKTVNGWAVPLYAKHKDALMAAVESLRSEYE